MPKTTALWQRCPECGEPKSWRAQRCRACYRKWARTPASRRWRGGTYAHDGYVHVSMPNHPRTDKEGYVKRALLVLEEKLGRPLGPGEVPHHINNIRYDDRPENLAALSQADHARETLGKLRGSCHPNWRGARVCPQCGGQKRCTAQMCYHCYTSSGRRVEAGKKAWANRLAKGGKG